MSIRRLGVEEELLLADAVTGELRPVADQVITSCRQAGAPALLAEVKQEFFRSQVEVASTPRTAVAEVRQELAAARSRIAEVGAAIGVAPLAVAGPVLPHTVWAPQDISPEDRYVEIARHYGDVAQRSLMCALHVHVEVSDDEEGVAVIDRLRPWVPALLAISTNSPYWHGQDTGYLSWRSRVWNMWPTSGPAEVFGSADRYHAVVGELVAQGAALDPALVNFDVRLSHHHPTVELRVADVCTDLDDAMLVAALARALVTHYAERWRSGEPPDDWRVDELRAACWRAARFGVDHTLVSPVSRDTAPAVEVLHELRDLLADSLESAGDLALVEAGIEALASRGSGATRQREAFARTGDLPGVLKDLQERTLAQ